MTKTRNTKRALLTSVFSLVVCFAMLIGSTFAWFTDNATTGVNKITAGNLDVELYYSADMEDWTDAETVTSIFDADKWEPGYTKVVYFKVTNAGSLAFNYKVATNIEKETPGVNQAGVPFKLSDYLRFGIKEVTVAFDERTAARDAIGEGVKFSDISTGKAVLTEDASQTFAMVVWMPEETTNVANHNGTNIPKIEFGINVIATQATVESDSFDNQYDKDADSEDTSEPESATVATAADLKSTLTQFTDADSEDKVINIVKDITLAEGETWTPVKIDGYNGAGVITINGNGHTISGLNDTLLDGGFAGNSGIVINDLTIADAKITSSNEQGYGAFVNCIDSMPKIELNNCHLVNSTITDTKGARVGGLIGWSAGYNNPNDGPVDTYITINNCSVTDCTITANGSVGAIIGHAGNNPATYHKITNCTVKNNVLTSTDDGGWRVGEVVGTANVGEVTITGTVTANNTLSQTGKTAPAGQSSLYGRFVPGTTGKLTIDGADIQ